MAFKSLETGESQPRRAIGIWKAAIAEIEILAETYNSRRATHSEEAQALKNPILRKAIEGQPLLVKGGLNQPSQVLINNDFGVELLIVEYHRHADAERIAYPTLNANHDLTRLTIVGPTAKPTERPSKELLRK